MNNVIPLIFRQADNYSNHKSVIYENSSITYKELRNRSILISHFLEEKYYSTFNKFIQSNEIIAISIDKNLDLIPTILGILKTGAAYLPIDPTLPIDRIKYILEDSKVKTCVMQSELIGKIQNFNLDTLFIDQEFLIESYHKRTENRKVLPKKDNTSSNSLAYIIYTSGSTGKPKGVSIEHRNLINLVKYQIDFFRLGQGCMVLGFANISFDASVWEYFSTLASGATLVLTDKNSILPGENLENTIQKYNITHLTLPPSTLALTSPKNLLGLSVVISAGEKLTDAIVDKWAGQPFKFYNAYGPTETTVCVSIAEVNKHSTAGVIGKPFANSKLYLLSDDMQTINSSDQVAELYIGGPGVGRGYINNKILTSKSFVHSLNYPSEILYKTGDWVKLNRNGDLEYIGRIDNQIKVRGFRVELDEVENNINLLRGVLFNTVIKDGDTLVAFIKKSSKQKFTADELRNKLKEKLPDYMIPSSFIFIKQIPQTHNGKVDKNKLLSKLARLRKNNNRTIANLSLTEKALIDIYKEVLQVEEIDVNDNFFKIGGHSLLITKIILAIKRNLNIKITINEFIEAETLKDLASKIDLIK